jgi:hypothetical protein
VAGKAALRIELPVSVKPDSITPPDREWFSRVENQLPLSVTDWQFTGMMQDSSVQLNLIPPSRLTGTNISEIYFLPYFPDTIAQGRSQVLLKTEEHYVLNIPLPVNRQKNPGRLSGILISDSVWCDGRSEKSVSVDVVIQ